MKLNEHINIRNIPCKVQSLSEKSEEKLNSYSEWCHIKSNNCDKSSPSNPILRKTLNYKNGLVSFESIILQLNDNTKNLCQNHNDVREKSKDMRQLWDHLIEQQGNFEVFAEKIEERLGVFNEIAKIESKLKINDPTIDLINPDFQSALKQAVQNTRLIQAKTDYKEFQVNFFRYKQILNTAFTAIKTAFNRHLTELNVYCREQDSPIQLEDLNQRYYSVSSIMVVLISILSDAVTIDNNFAQILHECMSKYLATRFNLSKRSMFPATIEEMSACVDIAFNWLETEQAMFSAFFGDIKTHERHYIYFCEQALESVTERLELMLKNIEEEQVSSIRSSLAKWESNSLFGAEILRIKIKSMIY